MRDLRSLKTAPIPQSLRNKIEPLELGIFFRAESGIQFEELCDAYPEVARLVDWSRTEAELAEVEVATYQAVPYREVYLWTDHWHWTAALAKYYAQDQCEASWGGRSCHRKGTDAHHLPWATVGREEPSDLFVVCRSCHDRIEREFDGNPPLEMFRLNAERTSAFRRLGSR